MSECLGRGARVGDKTGGLSTVGLDGKGSISWHFFSGRSFPFSLLNLASSEVAHSNQGFCTAAMDQHLLRSEQLHLSSHSSS